MARKRKSFPMLVIVTVPNWSNARQARQIVREQINHSTFDYYMEGPNFESGRIKAQRVLPAPGLTAKERDLCVRGLQKLRASTIYEDERATLQALADKMARAHV